MRKNSSHMDDLSYYYQQLYLNSTANLLKVMDFKKWHNQRIIRY